jgi:uncharacterized protein YndB with AHSA1/START domain
MNSEVSMSGNRLQVTRSFQASRKVVFSWWAEAAKFAQWSGCKQAVQCEVVMDFRVGGSFTQKMQIAVNGAACEFTITGTYDDIVEPERIGYLANLGPVPVRVTVEFFEQGAGTKVVITQEGLPDEFFGRNVSQGTTESFDKLDVLLAGQMALEKVAQ